MKKILLPLLSIIILVTYCNGYEDDILEYTIRGDSPVVEINGDIFVGMNEGKVIQEEHPPYDELELEIFNLSADGTYIQLIVYYNSEEIHNQIEIGDYAEIYYKK